MPALLPDGTPAELSVSPVIVSRGEFNPNLPGPDEFTATELGAAEPHAGELGAAEPGSGAGESQPSEHEGAR
jgi:hypothetical protein